MNSSFRFSYEKVSELLTYYYQEKYNDCKIVFDCYNKTEYSQDSYGFLDEELVLRGLIEYTKKTKAFGKETILQSWDSVDEKEIKKVLKEVLDEVLDKEGNNLEVSNITPSNNYIVITVEEKKINNKKTKKL